MPLTFHHLQTSLSILGWNRRAGAEKREVIGTGFIVSVDSDTRADVRHRFVVTAAHVLKGRDSVAIQAPDPTSSQPRLHDPVDIATADWFTPLDGYDVAVTPLPIMQRVPMYELPVALFNAWPPTLGEEIFYVGILTALGQPIPMVRTGTLAAIGVEGLRLEHGYNYPADLVDCRSYDGFSGSPCYVQHNYTMLDPPVDMDDLGAHGEQLRAYGVKAIGRTIYRAELAGMFTNHTSDKFDGYDPDDLDDDGNPMGVINRYGIGVMLRADFIKDALMTDEVRKHCRDAEDELAAEEDDDRPTISGASRTLGMDEPVKLPDDFGEAIRRVLPTQATNAGEDKEDAR